jgi:hypothetical protein
VSPFKPKDKALAAKLVSEHPIWVNKSKKHFISFLDLLIDFFNLVKDSPIKQDLSNMILILMDDTVFNVNSLIENDTISNLNKNNVLDQMLINYENGIEANDYDNLSFIVQLWSKLLTHKKDEQFDMERAKRMITQTMNLVLDKRQVRHSKDLFD